MTTQNIAKSVRNQAIKAEHVIEEALSRVKKAHGRTNGMVDIAADNARRAAKLVDERIRAGEGDKMPLAGVPIVVKANLCVGPDCGLDIRTTAGSAILEHYRSPYTATSVRRLIEAGAVVLGTTNMDEFGMGSSTETSIHGPTMNPWDLERVPGGSSGGSAAMVAAGAVTLALGSDTGGSIRQPAAMCGVVGFKPTYGRVSRYGLIAYASSLDTVGAIGTKVADVAAGFAAMAGVDERDATSVARPLGDIIAMVDAPPAAGLVVGVPRSVREHVQAGRLHAGVVKGLEKAEGALRNRGVQIIDVDLPYADEAIAAYYIIAPAEASSNLARYDGVRYGRRADLTPGEGLTQMYNRSRGERLGAEVQRRIVLGTFVLSSGYYDAYYLTALRARRLIQEAYNAAFAQGCQALLMPVTPGPAFRLGEKTNDPMAMYLEDVYTVGVNLAGLPAISVPVGYARDGAFESLKDDDRPGRLPIGVQLVGRAFDEGVLLHVAQQLEMGAAK